MKKVFKFLVLSILLCLISIPAFSTEKNALDEAESIIYRKLSEDRAYFKWRIKQKKTGEKPNDIKGQVFEDEIKRSKIMVPVINYMLQTINKKKAGERLEIARVKSPVYKMLANYLNLIGNVRASNFSRAKSNSDNINLSIGFGKTQSMKDYGLKLTRHYYYIKGIIMYHLHEDSNAVQWFGQIKKDEEVKNMNLKLKRDLENTRLADLHKKPIAVTLFKNNTNDKNKNWIKSAITEVVTNDLVNFTTLKVVERERMVDALKEIKLSKIGIVDETAASKFGRVLGASTIVIGSYSIIDNTFMVNGRLVHVESGTVLQSSVKRSAENAMFKTIREMTLDLLNKAGLLTVKESRQIETAHLPKNVAVKAISEARLLLASKPEKAKQLFEKAMKSDPAYANAFNELRMKFKDVAATVAVMPLANITKKKDDDWMSYGIAETLSTDIAVLGFRTVERLQLSTLLKQETELARQLALRGDDVSGLEIATIAKKATANFIIVGSYQHFANELKVNIRFLDVESAQILYTSSSTGKYEDYSKITTNLISNMSIYLNRPITEKQVAKMVKGKPTIKEFKQFMLKEVAKSELATKEELKKEKEKKKKKEEEKKKQLVITINKQVNEQVKEATKSNAMRKYISAGGVAAGLIVSGLGFYLFTSAAEKSYLAKGESRSEVNIDKLQELNTQIDDYSNQALLWNGVTLAGAGLTAASAVYWFLTKESEVDLKDLDMSILDDTKPKVSVVPLENAFAVTYKTNF